MVLSDQKMPGMTGVEFLGRVRDMAPHTVRLLVTAYGDAATLTSAINDGSIYRYVPKPWSHDDLGLNIRRGIELVALDREREHLMRELGTLNRVAQTINQELDIGPLSDLLLESLLDELGYDGAALLLREAHGDAFRIERSVPKGRSRASASAPGRRPSSSRVSWPASPRCSPSSRPARPRARLRRGCSRSQQTRSWWCR